MAVVFVLSHSEKPDVRLEFPMKDRLVVGKSVYCDVKIDDKLIANIQCEIKTAKTGHVIATNMDLKKEVLINQARLKRSPLKVDDVLKFGPFILSIDPNQLTPEEADVMNTEYIEYI
jgi:hypothetical protein